MADEIIIKAPQIDPNITINISGEDKLHSCTLGINNMLRGNKCYRYFKECDVLYSELEEKCKAFKMSITPKQAKDILNTYNAFLARSEDESCDISSIIENVISSIHNRFGDTLFPYTVAEFKVSFSTLECLRAYGLHLEDFLNVFENIREI